MQNYILRAYTYTYLIPQTRAKCIRIYVRTDTEHLQFKHYIHHKQASKQTNN